MGISPIYNIGEVVDNGELISHKLKGRSHDESKNCQNNHLLKMHLSSEGILVNGSSSRTIYLSRTSFMLNVAVMVMNIA